MTTRAVLLVGLVTVLGSALPDHAARAQGEMPLVQAAVPAVHQVTVPPVRTVAPDPDGRPEPAAPARWSEAGNVRIDVTISYQVGGSAPVRRSASLTIADASNGSLRAGNQVAVPATRFTPLVKPDTVGAAITEPSPMTSFSYRSVGLNLDVRGLDIAGTRARVRLSVEFSAVDEKTGDLATRPPSFPTFSQTFTVVLESGKPLVVAQSSDYVDNVERKQTVEVKATIVR